MAEYGVFNDEGCIYGPVSKDEAESVASTEKSYDDGRFADLISVKEICPDHEGQPKGSCEECFAG